VAISAYSVVVALMASDGRGAEEARVIYIWRRRSVLREERKDERCTSNKCLDFGN
jgi:hypothetical protein